MNPKTIINGKEYRFIKTVKELTTDRIAVLCEDEHGCSFICDAEMWKCGKAARRNIKQRSINTPHRIKKSSYQEWARLLKRMRKIEGGRATCESTGKHV